MAPPANNNIVNTPQSMTASLPQQNNMPLRHTASPSFSPPPQLQRGPEAIPQQPQPQTPHVNEAMMNSPMATQQLPPQHMMRNPQYNAIFTAAINACGLTGRDQSTWTVEEKNNVTMQMRRITFQQQNAIRANPGILVGNQQARIHMQQQAFMQQQQQQQQQAMLQQHQQLQQQQGQSPMSQMPPQRQEAQLPQQHHPMGQSPQVDPNQRMMGPGMNGQPRQHMNPAAAGIPGVIGPGAQMGLVGNMQNPNIMNGAFNGDGNLFDC
jgi:hypothetical protein